MSEILWARQQMSLRKLANQFLARLKNTNATRILITSVERGDGKARFIKELAGEMARVQQELIPLHAANLEFVNPDRFLNKLVIVYGPSYTESNGLHTIPERWMRAFDAAVILVMLRKTKQRDLMHLVSWLKEYNIGHIWPIVNEFKAPNTSQFWTWMKTRMGISKMSEPPPSFTARSVWEPVLSPVEELNALPPRANEEVDEHESVKTIMGVRAAPVKPVETTSIQPTDVVIVKKRISSKPPRKITVETDGPRSQPPKISSVPKSTATQIQVTNFSHTLTQRQIKTISSTPPPKINRINEVPKQVITARTTIRSSAPPPPRSKPDSDAPGDKDDVNKD